MNGTKENSWTISIKRSRIDIHVGTLLRIQDQYSFHNPDGEPVLKINMNILIFPYKLTNYINIYINNSKELDSLPEAKSIDFLQYCKSKHISCKNKT